MIKISLQYTLNLFIWFEMLIDNTDTYLLSVYTIFEILIQLSLSGLSTTTVKHLI